MRDERSINALGQVKRKFSYYAIVIAAIFFVLKLILNSSLILIDALPEIILIIGLIITSIAKPNEDIEDERVNRNLNEHYNNSFKILVPIILLGYILSVVLLFRTKALVIISPNLFINTFLFLIFIGVIYLLKNYKIYLNEPFLEKENYFSSVLKIIAYILIGSVTLYVISFLLNIIIPGQGVPSLVLVLMFLTSFLNLSVQYFLYSIYEYNHYKENIRISDGEIFIASKNIILYISIVFVPALLYGITNLITSYFVLIDNYTQIKLFITFGQYIGITKSVYNMVFLVILTYSLKGSLMRLKDYSFKEVKRIISLTNIYVLISSVVYIARQIFLLLFHNNSMALMLFQTISTWISVALLIFYTIILVKRFLYARRRSFPSNNLLLIPITLTTINIIIVLFSGLIKKLLNGSNNSLIYLHAYEVVSLIIIFVINVVLVFKYSKTYETIDFN